MMFLNAILEMLTNIFLEKFFIIIRKQALVLHEEQDVSLGLKILLVLFFYVLCI